MKDIIARAYEEKGRYIVESELEKVIAHTHIEDAAVFNGLTDVDVYTTSRHYSEGSDYNIVDSFLLDHWRHLDSSLHQHWWKLRHGISIDHVMMETNPFYNMIDNIASPLSRGSYAVRGSLHYEEGVLMYHLVRTDGMGQQSHMGFKPFHIVVEKLYVHAAPQRVLIAPYGKVLS